MNTATILNLIDARQTVATAFCDDLREQIAKLTGELTVAEAELADLQTTRQTLVKLTHNEVNRAGSGTA